MSYTTTNAFPNPASRELMQSNPHPQVSAGSSQEAVDPAKRAINRREFMIYSFAATTALLVSQGGLLTYSYLLPRFKAGEFGGTFDVGDAMELPSIDAAPILHADGKFWLINTEQGPKALYTVCTHLGCLYKWDAATRNFKCPCHASQFDREGNYVKGPAGRSLDQFAIATEEDQVVVDTGTKIRGTPNE